MDHRKREKSYFNASLDASKQRLTSTRSRTTSTSSISNEKQPPQEAPEETKEDTTAQKHQHLKALLQAKSSLRRKIVEEHQKTQEKTGAVTTTKDEENTATAIAVDTTRRVEGVQSSSDPIIRSTKPLHQPIGFGGLVQRMASVTREQRNEFEAAAQAKGHPVAKTLGHSQAHVQNRIRATEHPVFVLSLPGSASVTASNYFKCGWNRSSENDTENHNHEVAFYWTHRTNKNNKDDKEKIPIGQCLQENTQIHKLDNPLEGCGTSRIWSSMGYVTSPESTSSTEQCFFPSWNEQTMRHLSQYYPNATFVLVTQSPESWSDGLTSKFRKNLVENCGNANSEAPVPTSADASSDEWMELYEWHQQSTRQFMMHRPDLHYLEVSLESQDSSTTLYHEFGLSKQCWQPPNHDTYKEYNMPLQASESRDDAVAQLPYPILVASLPKSGTTSTQRFFQCGLGYYEAGHHWTHNYTSDKPMKIGKCMERNMLAGRDLFEDCGDYNIWADTGYLDNPTRPKAGVPKPGCYFPTLHGGLEAFYKSYPNGTLMNVLRDPQQWYNSAIKWRRLPERMAKQCHDKPIVGGDGSGGFPKPGSSVSSWIDFYNWHTQHVRDFALAHPSISYVEVSLEGENTGRILQNITGIPESCWGDCNPDKSKGKCGVLKDVRGYKGRLHDAQEGYSESEDDAGNDTELENRKWSEIEGKFNKLKDTPVKIINGKIQ